MVREAEEEELEEVLLLYTKLHQNEMPADSIKLHKLWKRIIEDKDYHIIVAKEEGRIVSSVTCVIIPNLTHEQRPYAFVENVITDEAYRKRGLASACLEFAKEIAVKENCYKMMLLTGSKKESTLKFYEQAGYNSKDKTAFIMWL